MEEVWELMLLGERHQSSPLLLPNIETEWWKHFMQRVLIKPQTNYIINHIMQLKHRHHCTKIYVDGANPDVIKELKTRIGEYHDYYGRLTEVQDIRALRNSNRWQIIPVNFQKIQRDATVEVYIDVKKVHQDTSITSEADSVTKNAIASDERK